MMGKGEFKEMSKKKISIIILGVIITPIILSQILRIPLGNITIGDEESWVSFFGGYIGGVIGGAVAFSVAWLQINQEKKQNKINILYNELPIYVGLSIEFEKIIEQIKYYKQYKQANTEKINSNFFRTLVIKLDALIWDRWRNKNISDTILLKELLKFEESFKRTIEVFEFDVDYHEEEATVFLNLGKSSDAELLIMLVNAMIDEKKHYWNEIEYCLEKAEKLQQAIQHKISTMEQVISGCLDINNFQQFTTIDELKVDRTV